MHFDSHMHTTFSDGKNSADEMCTAAVEKGMGGITITDHADMNFYESRDTYNRISKCMDALGPLQERYAGALQLSRGIELGEYLYDPTSADRVLSITHYDAVLCSVHLVPGAGWPMPYNRIPFTTEGTDEELRMYLKMYFDLLSETVDAFDFDILAHLTCPVRYMTGIHGRKTDVMEFEDRISEILVKIIKRNIALEINTGGMNAKCNYCNIQNDDILRLYRSMGGTMVTLGSDAHRVTSIGNGFDGAVAMLKELGFEDYLFYKNRKPCHIKI
jgi:histidinol-phosphatase (PHP family)